MKVLHINYSDKSGGASIAAYRHCEAMRLAGIDAKMLVVNKNRKNDKYIYTIKQNKYCLLFIQYLLLFIHGRFIKILKAFASFSFSFIGFNIHRHPLVLNSDIIYLHWVNNSMLSVKEIEKILKLGKPVYWYMHDMNPITGGCHHSFECKKYQSACKDCPFINKWMKIDFVKKQFEAKFKLWSKYQNFHIVTPSKWLGNCASNSTIFKNHKVFISPNVINTNLFKPINKSVAKNIFNLNSNKITLLFGADNINSEYKGWSYLRNALNELDPNKYECLIFGEYNEIIEHSVNINIHFTGYLSDQYSLILAYNASDIFITPSLADNFPNVLLEAMSCGIPCVGFNIGGIPDIITHKENGYIATYKNSNDLITGINWILENNYKNISINARNSIVSQYSYDKILEIHKELMNI